MIQDCINTKVFAHLALCIGLMAQYTMLNCVIVICKRCNLYADKVSKPNLDIHEKDITSQLLESLQDGGLAVRKWIGGMCGLPSLEAHTQTLRFLADFFKHSLAFTRASSVQGAAT